MARGFSKPPVERKVKQSVLDVSPPSITAPDAASPAAPAVVSESRASSEPEVPFLRLRPRRGWRTLDLGELWHYRDLLYFLAVRDIKVRYKQTALGVAWAVLQPLTAMIVFSIFLGKLVKVPSDGVPYPIFAYCALLPWQLFSQALTQASNSLIENERLVTKVYFPRLLIPFASVLSGLVDFAIAFVLFGVLLLYYGLHLGPSLLLLPVLVLFVVLAALSVGLWLSALNAHYRDFRYALPFVVQVWFYVSPVVYPSSIVPPRWQALYGLNPMAGVIEAFRWALLGTAHPAWPLLAASAAVVLALFFGGMFYFRRMERTLADWV